MQKTKRHKVTESGHSITRGALQGTASEQRAGAWRESAARTTREEGAGQGTGRAEAWRQEPTWKVCGPAPWEHAPDVLMSASESKGGGVRRSIQEGLYTPTGNVSKPIICAPLQALIAAAQIQILCKRQPVH